MGETDYSYSYTVSDYSPKMTPEDDGLGQLDYLSYLPANYWEKTDYMHPSPDPSMRYTVVHNIQDNEFYAASNKVPMERVVTNRYSYSNYGNKPDSPPSNGYSYSSY